MATSSVNSQFVDSFITVTGASRDVALSMFEACAGNLELAISMHMDSSVPADNGRPTDNSNHSSYQAASSSGNSSNQNGDSEDTIRAPIPQRNDVLMDSEELRTTFVTKMMRRTRKPASSVFDGFRNFQTETSHYENLARGRGSSKKRSLEDLFRPPIDITYKGTFQNAKDQGSNQNKWLLVNVQNVQEFSCQTLNRDVWSNSEVRALLKDSFVFWQVYSDSDEGKWFMQFYSFSSWPYVAVIDPFTGEKQVAWSEIPTAKAFCQLANEFLCSSPVPDTTQAPSGSKKMKREPSIVDASEQDQLEAAIRASLVERQKPEPAEYVEDSDSELDSDSDGFSSSNSEDIEIVQTNSKRKSKKCSNSVSSGSATNAQHKSQNNNSEEASSKWKDIESYLSQPSTSRSDRVRAIKNQARVPSLAVPNNGTDSQNTDTTWRAPNGLELNRDSPSDFTSSFMLGGGRRSEVQTPEICNLDSSSNSRLSPFDLDAQSSSQNSTKPISEDWTDYWGESSDAKSKIVIRLPENVREQVTLPCSSKLKALFVFCQSKGFPSDKYELVTNFPRRRLSELTDDTTLQQAGLHPQETVFIQEI